MVQFKYRMQDEKGEWKTFSSESTWKTVADALKAFAKDPEMCDWLLTTKAYYYFKEVAGDGSVRKCPI